MCIWNDSGLVDLDNECLWLRSWGTAGYKVVCAMEWQKWRSEAGGEEVSQKSEVGCQKEREDREDSQIVKRFSSANSSG